MIGHVSHSIGRHMSIFFIFIFIMSQHVSSIIDGHLLIFL